MYAAIKNILDNKNGTYSLTVECIDKNCTNFILFTGKRNKPIEKSCEKCGHRQGVVISDALIAELDKEQE